MKTRTGFVSNSSTSSFIIAVPNTISEYEDHFLRLFEDIVNQIKTERPDYFQFLNYQDQVNVLQEKIKDLKNDIRILNNETKVIQDLRVNKDIIDKFLSVVAHNDFLKKEFTIESLEGNPYCSLDGTQDKINLFVKIKTNEISKNEKKLSELEKYKDCKYIAQFEMDINWNSHLEKALEYLIHHKIVKLIERTTS